MPTIMLRNTPCHRLIEGQINCALLLEFVTEIPEAKGQAPSRFVMSGAGEPA